MPDKLVLIGAGGHARSCVGVIESSGRYTVHGYIDHGFAAGTMMLGYPVLGDNQLIAALAKENNVQFIIAVGQIKSAALRIEIFGLLQQAGATICSPVVAKSAYVSQHASVGDGTIVMHQAVVNANARVGSNVILNNFCLIEHDAVVGSHTHISTGALVNGGCTIGERVFIGSGAVLSQGVTISDEVVVGAGSIVNRSITEPGIYAGNPAKKIS